MDTNTRHIAAVTDWLTIELGFVSDMGTETLYTAVVEALKNGGVLGEAEVVYIRGSGPGILRGAVDIFVPDTDEPEEEDIPQVTFKATITDTYERKNDNPECQNCGVLLSIHEDVCKVKERDIIEAKQEANKQSRPEDVT